MVVNTNHRPIVSDDGSKITRGSSIKQTSPSPVILAPERPFTVRKFSDRDLITISDRPTNSSTTSPIIRFRTSRRSTLQWLAADRFSSAVWSCP